METIMAYPFFDIMVEEGCHYMNALFNYFHKTWKSFDAKVSFGDMEQFLYRKI